MPNWTANIIRAEGDPHREFTPAAEGIETPADRNRIRHRLRQVRQQLSGPDLQRPRQLADDIQ